MHARKTTQSNRFISAIFAAAKSRWGRHCQFDSYQMGHFENTPLALTSKNLLKLNLHFSVRDAPSAARPLLWISNHQ
jgi:hypothetical protein